MSEITSETLSTRFPELTSSLGSGDLEALVGAFELREADPGEALVAEGTSSGDLFLVWDGELDVAIRGVGGDRTVARLGPGSYFGEVSLLDPGLSGATIVTEQGAVVLRLSRARLDELRRSRPEAAAALLREVVRSLAVRLRGAAAQATAAAAGRS
jgi:CRP-like cAMP-binding protein